VLTHRFWSTALQSDPSVLGKPVRLDVGFEDNAGRAAVIVGVLEPSIPYPAETELFANVVTSPHHLSAAMVVGVPTGNSNRGPRASHDRRVRSPVAFVHAGSRAGAVDPALEVVAWLEERGGRNKWEWL
jgi:hypothetical protein